jgi:hypothetical protein
VRAVGRDQILRRHRLFRATVAGPDSADDLAGALLETHQLGAETVLGAQLLGPLAQPPRLSTAMIAPFWTNSFAAAASTASCSPTPRKISMVRW